MCKLLLVYVFLNYIYIFTFYLGAPFKCYIMQSGVRVSDFPEKSIMKMHGSTLLALKCYIMQREWVGVEFQHLNGQINAKFYD